MKLLIIPLLLCMQAGAQQKTDTLEIPAGIHFVKVDGHVFEIKREVSITQVQKPERPNWMRIDTMPQINYYFPLQGLNGTLSDTTTAHGTLKLLKAY